MNGEQIVEILGILFGLFLAYWFIIKPQLKPKKDLYECEYCKKRIYGKEECQKHEQECKNKKGNNT